MSQTGLWKTEEWSRQIPGIETRRVGQPQVVIVPATPKTIKMGQPITHGAGCWHQGIVVDV
jgi:hypothetical protein